MQNYRNIIYYTSIYVFYMPNSKDIYTPLKGKKGKIICCFDLTIFISD